jgi:hypothetical protein
MIDFFALVMSSKKSGSPLKCQVFERETTHGEEVQLLGMEIITAIKNLTPLINRCQEKNATLW